MKKIFIVFVIVFLLTTVSSLFRKQDNTTTSSPPPIKQIDKQTQQDEFLKLYRIALSGIKVSNLMFYTTHNLLNKASRSSVYDALKDSEATQEKMTVAFTTLSAGIDKIHPSLKEYRSDIAQSFDELAGVFAHRQQEAKYLADYINTGNLESYRKTKTEIEGTGETMANAVSRLVLGIGKNLGMDTKALDEEYQKISVEVKQDFENRFGKTIK